MNCITEPESPSNQGNLMPFFLLIKTACPDVTFYFTVHDTYIFSSDLNEMDRKIANLICKRIIAISDGVVKDIRSCGIKKEKIKRIYNTKSIRNCMCGWICVMARQNQESVTTFGEVLHSSNISYSQNRSSANDNRLMIYFQGMKVYIPDNFQPDTLLKLLQTLKKL